MAPNPPNGGLPSGFRSADDILTSQCAPGSMVSSVGLVIDARAPVATRGSDWKYGIQLYDLSTQYEVTTTLTYDIFLPRDLMPSPGVGDVMVMQHVKCQQFRTNPPSLLHNQMSKFWVFAADKMPAQGKDPSEAIRSEGPYGSFKPSIAVLQYVSHFFHKINKERLPDVHQFEANKLRSLNIKEKATELKNVVEGRFCDVVANIVRDPYDAGGYTTLWISDFTENRNFHNFPYNNTSTGDDQCQDGDPYGYISKYSNGTAQTDSNQWPGPYGQRSMQITCWDPHASYIHDHKIGFGDWVAIKNLQIAWGRNGGNLEGKLRTDGDKILIHRLDPSELTGAEGERLKNALVRKRTYKQTQEADKKRLDKAIEAAAAAGAKRSAAVALADSESTGTPGVKKPSSSRLKRQAKRQKQLQERTESLASERGSAEPKATGENNTLLEPSDISRRTSDPVMNPEGLVQSHFVEANPADRLVACEHYDKTSTPIAEMTAPIFVTVELDGLGPEKVLVPFVNALHRSYLRVVDFQPRSLEGFCRPKKARPANEFDALSDNEDDPSSSGSSESEFDSEATNSTSDEWEFQFALKLADASDSHEDAQDLWVQVNNASAEYLTGLKAANLRSDNETLNQLRQTMFQLWGNLEEQRSRQQKPGKAMKQADRDIPPDSSMEAGGDDDDDGASRPTNLPFPCCIRQYGVKVSEEDPSRCDAGPQMRWKRCFMLHGTKIRNR